MGQYGKLWGQNKKYYGGGPRPTRQIGGVINPAAAAETEIR